MKQHISFAALVATVLLALTSCSNSDKNGGTAPEYNPGTINLSAAQLTMSKKTNSFAWQMMEAGSKSANQNSMVISPLSMVYCLGMVNTGAAGETSGEITKALGFDAGVADINQYCRKLLDEMPKLDSRTTMNIANCVEVNKPYDLLPDYKKSVANSYDALVENRDFADSGFKDYVNKWVSNHTDGMIPKLFDEINADAVAYIINALYFKGLWTEQFKKENTKPSSFTCADGDYKMVDMMNQTEDFGYYDDDTFQALSMNYGNGSYSMQVLLPQEGKTIDDVIDVIKRQDWKTFVDAMSTYETVVKLPRFTIEYGGEMNSLLQQLGIKQMFTTEADFSNFCELSTYITKVVQKAKIEVNEEGTKAAAATYAEVGLTSAGPGSTRYFYAVRPFIFVITEHSTGTICFMGQYTGK